MKFFPHSFRFANNQNKSHESDVLPGLSYTPSETARMLSRGANINLDVMSSSAMYDTDNSMRLSIDQMRGVDINDVFEAESSSSDKLRAFKKAIDKSKIVKS